MSKTALVAALGVTLGLAAATDAALAFRLAATHSPFVVPLVGGFCALVPGVAALALSLNDRLRADAQGARR